jgi:XTP/dITP diphosphohydrolase
MKIVLATNNPNKLKEFSSLAESENWLSLELAPKEFSCEETGKTFFENAQLKAKAAALLTGQIAVADDSGLIVEALNGKPGVHSSRYCEGSDKDRRQKLLSEMVKIPMESRQAAFMCAMTVCDPKGDILFSSMGCWEGKIALEEKGENGFGYDSIFYPTNSKITAGEITEEEKNKMSHRYKAWQKVIAFLKGLDQAKSTK